MDNLVEEIQNVNFDVVTVDVTFVKMGLARGADSQGSELAHPKPYGWARVRKFQPPSVSSFQFYLGSDIFLCVCRFHPTHNHSFECYEYVLGEVPVRLTGFVSSTPPLPIHLAQLYHCWDMVRGRNIKILSWALMTLVTARMITTWSKLQVMMVGCSDSLTIAIRCKCRLIFYNFPCLVLKFYLGKAVELSYFQPSCFKTPIRTLKDFTSVSENTLHTLKFPAYYR